LENISLYEAASWYNYQKSQCKKCSKDSKHEHCFELKKNLGYLQRRNNKCILKLPYFNLKDDNAKEKICYQKLLLFLPWRVETNLIGNYDSYSQALDNIDITKINKTVFEKFESQLSKAKELFETIQILKDQKNNKINDEVNDQYNEKSLGITDFHIKKINITQLINKINQLNSDQKAVYDKIMYQIENKNKENGLRLFCSGVGGK
jgi:bacterioferritin (cytochrome b1)